MLRHWYAHRHPNRGVMVGLESANNKADARADEPLA
jgi:hypothetical protein